MKCGEKYLYLILVLAFAQATEAKACIDSFRAKVDQANQITQEILKKRGNVVNVKTISGGVDGQDIIFVKGVPTQVRQIDHDGKLVFRHYSKASISDILSSRSLIVGPRPYIAPQAHARKQYEDLSGIMFSTPEFRPESLWMGYGAKTPWVDFTLDPQVPVLEVSPGNYLIPAHKNHPAWFREKYEEFVKSGNGGHFEAEFKNIQQAGGILPAFEIQIQIIKSSADQ